MLIHNEGNNVSDLRQQHEIESEKKKRETKMSRTIRYYPSHSLSKSIVHHIWRSIFFLHASSKRWQIYSRCVQYATYRIVDRTYYMQRFDCFHSLLIIVEGKKKLRRLGCSSDNHHMFTLKSFCCLCCQWKPNIKFYLFCDWREKKTIREWLHFIFIALNSE